MQSLSKFIVGHRWWIIGAWIGLLVVVGGLSSQLAGEWEADYSTPGTESGAVATMLTERFGDAGAGDSIDVVWEVPGSDGAAVGAGGDGGAAQPAGAPAAEGAAAAQVAAYLEQAKELEGIAQAGEPQIAPDGTIGMASLTLDRRDWEVPLETAETLIDRAEAASDETVRIELAGGIIQAAGEAAEPEVIGMFAALIILLVAFGSVVAAGLPLLTALFGLGVASALIGLLAAVLPVPDWATAVTALIGIALGIDYTLLILTRFRAALARGGDVRAAIAESLATAGRSVLVAGVTVIIALGGLILMRLSFMTGVAFAAMLAVLAAMGAALFLVPALLAVVGRRVDRLRIPGLGRGAWGESGPAAARWSRTVQRRPLIAATLATAVLLALAAPLLNMHLGFPDYSTDAEGTTTRAAYDLIAEGFGEGATGPLLVTADLNGADPGEPQGAVAGPGGPAGAGAGSDTADLRTAGERLGATEGVAGVAGPQLSPDGSLALFVVTPTTSPQETATEDLVHRLRDDVAPSAFAATGAEPQVGGLSAAFIDQSDLMAARMPVFIGGVVLISLLLLLVAFRAPVIAVKAGIVNLLSVGAAYGIVALASQGGAFGELVGISTATPVAPFIPVIMFAILFGLSMDYEVFLLSRIREEYLRGGDTAAAVTAGLAKTARVITAAAAIMVAVFSAFLLSSEVFLKQLGLGMAAAIAIDASLVRMVLVPAVMQLLGGGNWWIPDWLDRLLPDFDLEHQEIEAAGDDSDSPAGSDGDPGSSPGPDVPPSAEPAPAER